MAHFSGLALLLAGRLAEGWDEDQWRFRTGTMRLPACSVPQWMGEARGMGEARNGRTLLIRAEQGMGDTIQFCRYVTMAAVGGPVVLEVQPGLQRLLSRDLAGVPIVSAGDALPDFQLWTPLLSLPRLLGLQAPMPPYLTAEADRVARWRARIGAQGCKIGIAWQGNPAAAVERGRSIPLREFAPLAQVPGVRLISLQKHHGLDQLASLQSELRIETLGKRSTPGPMRLSIRPR